MMGRTDHAPEGPEALLAWSEFRDGLKTLDVKRVDGSEDQRCSWIVDSDFGGLSLRNVGSNGVSLWGERTPSRINDYHEELIWTCVVIRGALKITQHRETAALTVGDIVMVDALQRYRIETGVEPIDTLWIGTPRTFVSRHIWDVDELLGLRIDGKAGAGRVASRALIAGFSDGQALRRGDADRIAHGLLDILGVAADACRMADAKHPYRSAVMRRIKTFIDCHIDDETLTVQRIADAQGLSPRYLAKMFESEAQTVSGWIWSRRLERCHAALVGSRGRRRITDIALDHGFKNVSHFSRKFRDQFGVSPREVAQSAARIN